MSTNNSNALQPSDNKSFHCSSFFELIASRPVDVIPCSERRIQAIGLGKGGRIDEHAVAIARNFGTGVMEYPNPGVRIVSFGVQGGGLNQNCNKRLKDVFVGAATSGSRRRPFEPLVEKLKQNGMRAEMARLTLARKIAAVALIVWKKGVEFDPKKLNLTT